MVNNIWLSYVVSRYVVHGTKKAINSRVMDEHSRVHGSLGRETSKKKYAINLSPYFAFLQQ